MKYVYSKKYGMSAIIAVYLWFVVALGMVSSGVLGTYKWLAYCGLFFITVCCVLFYVHPLTAFRDEIKDVCYYKDAGKITLRYAGREYLLVLDKGAEHPFAGRIWVYGENNRTLNILHAKRILNIVCWYFTEHMDYVSVLDGSEPTT